MSGYNQKLTDEGSKGLLSPRVLLAALTAIALVVAAGCATRESRGAIVAALSGVNGTQEPSGAAATTPSGAGLQSNTGATSSDVASAGAGGTAVSGGASAGTSGVGAASAALTPGPGAASRTAAASGTQPTASSGLLTPSAGRAGPGAGNGPVSGTSGGGAASTTLGCVGPGTNTPVAIGNIGEYSGVVGASLGSGRPMAQVVIKWINAHCGLNGHPVTFFQADDASDPARYLTEAQNMVESNHVIAFFGQDVPISAPGADSYLTQAGIPVIGGDGAHALWCQSTDMFFPGACLDTISVAAVDYAVKIGKPKVGLLYCGEADPCRVIRNAILSQRAAKTGFQLVYSAQVSLVQPDYTAECLQAQSHGAQALVITTDSNSTERLTRACAQQGYHPQYLTLGPGVAGYIVSDPDTNGIFVPTPHFPFMANDLPGEQAYHQAIHEYDPGLVEADTTAEIWLDGLILSRATSSLSSNPSAQEVLNGLWAIKNETFGGLSTPVTFAKGQPSPNSNCYYIFQNQNGRWVAPIASRTDCL